jgi:hypothetical protein
MSVTVVDSSTWFASKQRRPAAFAKHRRASQEPEGRRREGARISALGVGPQRT